MKKLLFHTQNYTYLADKVMTEGDFEEGVVELKNFSDGEHYQRILSDVEDRDVVLLDGTVDDASTMELLDLASSLVSYGADSLILVVPYFGYSTMERAVLPGEVVTAKTRARLLSAIPRSNRGNKIYLFDLHTEGIPHYFEHHLYPIHVYCKELVMQVALTSCWLAPMPGVLSGLSRWPTTWGWELPSCSSAGPRGIAPK